MGNILCVGVLRPRFCNERDLVAPLNACGVIDHPGCSLISATLLCGVSPQVDTILAGFLVLSVVGKDNEQITKDEEKVQVRT